VTGESVLLDHLAHVLEDLGAGGDRRSDPGLEAIAKGVEVAVGADAWVFVGVPGAAEVRLVLQDREAEVRRLLGQVVGRADARDAGADDEDVEVLDRVRRLRRPFEGARVAHPSS